MCVYAAAHFAKWKSRRCDADKKYCAYTKKRVNDLLIKFIRVHIYIIYVYKANEGWLWAALSTT